MTLSSCTREKEVKELLQRGHWPEACPAELRTHVSGCRACGDLVLVSEAFCRARVQAAGAAKLSSPGVLWWRAQLRRRNAAVERMGRPLLGAQIFALCVTLSLSVGFVAFEARNGIAWPNWLQELPQAGSLHLDAILPSGLFSTGLSPMVLVPAVATLALLGGVVVYLAAEKQ